MKDFFPDSFGQEGGCTLHITHGGASYTAKYGNWPVIIRQ